MHELDDVAKEFATVEAVLASSGTTKRTDAFILTWVKMEKQARRLFCFLVYQHPSFDTKNIDHIIEVIVENRELGFSSFIKCIDALGTPRVRNMVGDGYDEWRKDIERIRRYRNKILHGLITGQKISSAQLAKDTAILRAWIAALSAGAEGAIGYNGVGRNTFRKAKAASPAIKDAYPFQDVKQFEEWLKKNAAR